MSLSPEEREFLLNLARESIDCVAQDEDPPMIDMDAVPPGLQQSGASFVTLNNRGGLRGCVGSLEARRPLVLDVQQNGIGAAFRDPRFPPVQREEVDDLDIEISVLSSPERLDYDGPGELFNKLRPDVDGVVIELGWHRATFLPQVWEKLPDKDQFLQRLCLKAGLSSDAYRSGDLDVYTYQVEKFKD
ncbi:MAG: AmmeMemoRadiSam system protein A [Anaerolineae bacterium]